MVVNLRLTLAHKENLAIVVTVSGFGVATPSQDGSIHLIGYSIRGKLLNPSSAWVSPALPTKPISHETLKPEAFRTLKALGLRLRDIPP